MTAPRQYPYVIKLDWGGEGQTVYLINSDESLQQILKQIAGFEKSGQSGFLLQEYIPSGRRTLRIAAIGRQLFSYWRVQPDINNFYTNLRSGAIIEPETHPELQRQAEVAVREICRATGINLAGFDIIFSTKLKDPQPLLLEINYFFGRRGLGGSEAFYKILQAEIQAWLDSIG